MKSFKFDEEDLEFYQKRLNNLKQLREILADKILKCWNEHGQPIPDKKELDQDKATNLWIAKNWVKHGDDVPSNVIEFLTHHKFVSGKINELKRLTKATENIFEEDDSNMNYDVDYEIDDVVIIGETSLKNVEKGDKGVVVGKIKNSKIPVRLSKNKTVYGMRPHEITLLNGHKDAYDIPFGEILKLSDQIHTFLGSESANYFDLDTDVREKGSIAMYITYSSYDPQLSELKSEFVDKHPLVREVIYTDVDDDSFFTFYLNLEFEGESNE